MKKPNNILFRVRRVIESVGKSCVGLSGLPTALPSVAPPALPSVALRVRKGRKAVEKFIGIFSFDISVLSALSVRNKSRALPAGFAYSFKLIVLLLLIVGVFGSEAFGGIRCQ